MKYPKRWLMPREMIKFNLSGREEYEGIDLCLHYLGKRRRMRLRAIMLDMPF